MKDFLYVKLNLGARTRGISVFYNCYCCPWKSNHNWLQGDIYIYIYIYIYMYIIYYIYMYIEREREIYIQTDRQTERESGWRLVLSRDSTFVRTRVTSIWVIKHYQCWRLNTNCLYRNMILYIYIYIYIYAKILLQYGCTHPIITPRCHLCGCR